MSRNSTTKIRRAALATLPLGCAFVSGLLITPRMASATATWTGAVSDSWGDPANWVGSAPIPPGVPQATNGTGQGDAWIGNNGTVFYNDFMSGSGTIVVGRIHVGYDAPGAGLPGPGTLNINAGALSTQQFNFIGDGAVGTLNINGGMLDTHGTDNTKDTVLAFSSDGVINISSGTFVTSEYGIEQGGGFGTINLSGGTLRLGQLDSATTRAELGAEADFFSFTGGELFQPRAMTIHHVAGNGSITTEVSTGSVITFDIAGNDTWNGTMNSGAAGVGILEKAGPGTLTFTAAQNYERGTNVNAGTLVLDYTSTPSILMSVSSISLGGGTLYYKGDSSNQVTAKLQTSANGSTVIADPNAGGATTLFVGSLARNVGATVDFQGAGTAVVGTDVIYGTSTGNNANGIVGAWATVNHYSDWAMTQGGVIKPFTAYDTSNGFSDATANYLASSNAALSGAAVANSVKLTGSAGIDMSGGGSLVLTSGGILANTTGSISGGSLTSSNGVATSAASDLVVVTPADLTISSVITDNGSGSVSLTKTGPAALTISGANNYSGNTYINGGMLKLGGNDVIPTNSIVSLGSDVGPVLDLNGFNQTLNAINSGFADSSGGGIGTITPTTGGGEVKVGGGTLTLQVSQGTMSYGGSFSGTGTVIFNSGVSTLSSSSSSFTGSMVVQNGATLAVTNVGDGGSNSGLGASSDASSLVLDGGSLSYVGRVHGSTDHLFSIGPNGGTLSAYGMNSSRKHSGAYGMIHFTNPGQLGMTGSPSARILHLTGDGGTFSGSLSELGGSLAASIPDSGPGAQTRVDKDGTGLWLLSGSSTYTGQTNVFAGTLSVTTLANGGQPSSIGASTSDSSNLSVAGGTLRYVGTGSSTDRLINVGGSTAGFDSSGTGPVNFTNTGTLGGSTQIVLTGSNTDANTFAPLINGSLLKSGGGAWTVTNAGNNISLTDIGQGTLSIPMINNTGATSPVGTGTVIMSGGALNYVGSGDSSNRTLFFTGSSTLSSSGSGAVTYNGTVDLSGATGGVTIGLGGTNTALNTVTPAIHDAAGTNSVTKSGPGTWVLNGANDYSGTTTVRGGKLILANGAKTPVLTLGGADIQGGRLVLDYNDTGTAPDVKSILTAGFGQSPKFSSGQIRTSNPAATDKGLGWKDDTAAKQVTVGYTYYGDANLDGQVDVTDLGALATNWQTSNVWAGGDFNYDGFVDVTDLGALATNWQKGVGSPLGPGSLQAALQSVGLGNVSVPEPASIGLLGLGLVGLASRRRRRASCR